MRITSLQQKRREYYVTNRDKILKRTAEANKKNPFPARERAKKFAKKNPEKVKRYQKTWKERHPEKRKLYTRNSRIRAYGIEPEEYYKLLEQQGNGCAICRAKSTYRAMNIDHDHKTGKVRGLLCDTCNLSLGHLERGEWVEKANKYLAIYK